MSTRCHLHSILPPQGSHAQLKVYSTDIQSGGRSAAASLHPGFTNSAFLGSFGALGDPLTTGAPVLTWRSIAKLIQPFWEPQLHRTSKQEALQKARPSVGSETARLKPPTCSSVPRLTNQDPSRQPYPRQVPQTCLVVPEPFLAPSCLFSFMVRRISITSGSR